MVAAVEGKVVVVTGSTNGIGRAAIKAIHASGATVVAACRSPDKGKRLVEELGERASYVLVDLSLQASIVAFAEKLKDQVEHVDVLVNNAGIFPRGRKLTDEGVERTWATNVLGYFSTTRLLLPLLEKAGTARIVDVASTMTGDFDIDDVEFKRRKFGNIKAYKQSKQANRMLAWAWDEKLPDNISINVVHPGMVATNIQHNQLFPIRQVMALYWKWKGVTPEQGADTVVWLATDPVHDGVSGKFWARRKERECQYRDMTECRRLWDLCKERTDHILTGH